MQNSKWKWLSDLFDSRWLANLFEWLGEVFETFNPAAFRFLAAFLPYLTPFPVAWLTMKSAEKFLEFTPAVAFTFVFALEGLGLWFTSLFVDAIIAWIRSRNIKTFALVALFGAVVSAYVYLLINLNVTLKGGNDPVLQDVITLLCFLPLLSGIGNGYYKWNLEQKVEQKSEKELARQIEEQRHQEKRQDKRESRLLKYGINPLTQYQSAVQVTKEPEKEKKKDDWRLLSPQEKYEVRHVLSPEAIMSKFGVSRATAYNWKSKTV